MRKEKQLLLDDIRSKIDHSQALFFTRYQKLSANKTADFRKKMIASKGDFEVVRKRILLKAAQASGMPLDLGMLEGHIGIVFALEDPVAVTKTLAQFSSENEEALEILGGRFEGKMCSGKEIEQIALLPGKDEMRAQLLSVLEAPLGQTLAVMESLLTSVMHCLQNKSETNQE